MPGRSRAFIPYAYINHPNPTQLHSYDGSTSANYFMQGAKYGYRYWWHPRKLLHRQPRVAPRSFSAKNMRPWKKPSSLKAHIGKVLSMKRLSYPIYALKHRAASSKSKTVVLQQLRGKLRYSSCDESYDTAVAHTHSRAMWGFFSRCGARNPTSSNVSSEIR